MRGQYPLGRHDVERRMFMPLCTQLRLDTYSNHQHGPERMCADGQLGTISWCVCADDV